MTKHDDPRDEAPTPWQQLQATQLARQAALVSYDLTPPRPEPSLDALAHLAATLCQAPQAAIVLLGPEQGWLLAGHGVQPSQAPLLSALSAAALSVDDVVVRQDTSQLTLGAGEPPFLAAVALRTSEGVALGALCVMDDHPRALDAAPRQGLQTLAGQIMMTLERRRSSEARYQELFESNPQPMFIYDLETLRFLAFNDATLARYGYSRHELLSMTIKDIRPAEDIPALLHNIAQVAHGLDQAGLWRHKTRDGRVFDVEITSHTLTYGGRPAELVLAQDVSARVQAQRALAALRESEARLARAQRAAGLGSWELLIHAEHFTFTPHTYEIFGVHPETFSHTREGYFALFHPEDLPDLLRSRQAIIDGAKVVHGEHRIVRPDGQVRWISHRAEVQHDEAGVPWRTIGTILDVTERKRMERQLLRAQRLELLGSLAGGIAHDMNNILAPIMTITSMLHAQEREPERLDDLELIATCAQRGADMIQQLLLFARGSEDRKVKLELGPILRDVLKLVRDTFPKHVELVAQVPESLPWLEGNPTQLHQLLTNLCVNARDAMPQGGRLTLRASSVQVDALYQQMCPELAPGDHLMIEVQDTGSGIKPELLEQIFEPFFTTKAPGQGTGLGLSTALAIAREHGGQLRVTSAPGRGACFQVFLPALAQEHTLERSHPSQVSWPQGGGQLILLVDDEEAIRHVSSRALEQQGYRVALAEHGAQAVAQLSQRRGEVSLVVLDMEMPVMGGEQALGALRHLAPEVPVLCTSGASADSQPTGVMLLPKPYTASQLVEAVWRALMREGAT